MRDFGKLVNIFVHRKKGRAVLKSKADPLHYRWQERLAHEMTASEDDLKEPLQSWNIQTTTGKKLPRYGRASVLGAQWPHPAKRKRGRPRSISSSKEVLPQAIAVTRPAVHLASSFLADHLSSPKFLQASGMWTTFSKLKSKLARPLFVCCTISILHQQQFAMRHFRNVGMTIDMKKT